MVLVKWTLRTLIIYLALKSLYLPVKNVLRLQKSAKSAYTFDLKRNRVDP